jgi:hypothetical protein
MLLSFEPTPIVCARDGVNTKHLSKFTYKWNKDEMIKVSKICGVTFGLIFVILNVQKCVLRLTVYK